MEKLVVEGMKKLKGRVKVGASKNAVLPVIAATLLTEEECEILNPPRLRDVYDMLELIKYYGAEVSWEDTLKICCKNIEFKPPNEKAQKIRASFLLAGGLLARFKKAHMYMPGGCSIGLRPVDLHLMGFCKMGGEYSLENGIIKIEAKEMKGCDIYLDFPSVGATENIILAAVFSKGITRIMNCATEPEIVCMADFLCSMGANIKGAGSETIEIKGTDSLCGASFKIIPDRIEAGTYMLAAASAGEECRIENVICQHIKPLILKLREVGAEVSEGNDYVDVISHGRIKNTHIKTLPYPGFPTDMQSQFMSLMVKGEGTGIVNETIFENRFMYINELKKMGADITLEGRSAIVKGVDKIMGAKVKANDLRAGAALVISALSAEGITEIGDIHYIDRGYECIEEKLKGLGANIKRVRE